MTAPSPPQEFRLIDIREVWPGEAMDFTPWLGDNLEALSDHLEIDELELVSTEVEVPGGRKLDILAKDADGRNWAIENQYGEADHDHLTRALAYAVGLECRAVIVVAESHRDEFLAVGDEWNRYSEAYGAEGIRLFLVAIEAGRIGDSAPGFRFRLVAGPNEAPGFRFRLVAGPNEWKSATAAGPRPSSDADHDREVARKEFWTGLQKVMGSRGDLLKASTAGRGASYVAIVSKGPFYFQFWVRMNSCRVQLRIESGDGEQNDELYNSIANHREAIHDALDAKLVWENNPKRARGLLVGGVPAVSPVDELDRNDEYDGEGELR